MRNIDIFIIFLFIYLLVCFFVSALTGLWGGGGLISEFMMKSSENPDTKYQQQQHFFNLNLD